MAEKTEEKEGNYVLVLAVYVVWSLLGGRTHL